MIDKDKDRALSRREILGAGMAGASALALTACGARPADTTAANNEALATQYVRRVFEGGDLSAVDEFIDPDHIYRSAGMGPLIGQEALAERLNDWLGGFTDRVVQLDQVVADGRTVAMSMTITGTHSGEFRGLPATAKPVEIHSNLVMTIDPSGRRIIETVNLKDYAALEAQLASDRDLTGSKTA